MRITRRNAALGFTSGALLTLASGRAAFAASASALTREANAALQNLLQQQPNASVLANKAKAVLVFPSIVKAGFIFGAQTGDGVLFQNGVPTKYYNISAASFGLQAGAQSFSYALFFMTDSALAYLASSSGWAIGTGPSVVVLDAGAAKSITSTTLSQDVYAIPFNQKGLMAGIGLEGSKITSINPGP
jgi:lipid-binding SYLF domain-containing protein